MLNTIVVLIRFIVLIFGGQKQVALENAALRQQLSVFKRDVQRYRTPNRHLDGAADRGSVSGRHSASLLGTRS